MILIGIVLVMVIWLFCLTCVMDSKVSKIAADIAEIKNTSTNTTKDKIISLCIGCVKENCSLRSEIKSCPVTLCANRQAK